MLSPRLARSYPTVNPPYEYPPPMEIAGKGPASFRMPLRILVPRWSVLSFSESAPASDADHRLDVTGERETERGARDGDGKECLHSSDDVRRLFAPGAREQSVHESRNVEHGKRRVIVYESENTVGEDRTERECQEEVRLIGVRGDARVLPPDGRLLEVRKHGRSELLYDHLEVPAEPREILGGDACRNQQDDRNDCRETLHGRTSLSGGMLSLAYAFC